MNFKVKSVMSQSLKNTTMMTSNIKKMKHKKLDEDWFETREPIQDGIRFSAKYLGITLVDEPKGDVLSAAVQRILTMSKGTKKPAVQLMVSSKGIKVLDQTSSRIINDIEIQRISFCAALKHHMKVFAFVARNDKNEKMECYAYLCNTIKEAQTLTVTVAQSFKIAFEIGEEELSTDGVENDKQDSDVQVIKGEKKSAQITMPIVVEKRYQRFSSDSNPFATSHHEVSSPADPNQSMNVKEKQAEGSSVGDFGDVFIFTSPLPTFPQHSATPKSAPPITPLRPPPASTRQSDKASSRRLLARPTSVGSPLPNLTMLHQALPSPVQSAPDVEDWDQGFADLALSRTQEKLSPTEEAALKTPIKISYPPSNPFCSPSNPFHS